MEYTISVGTLEKAIPVRHYLLFEKWWTDKCRLSLWADVYKRQLLCCGAGMSSGFLAQQMRIAAKKMNVVAKIEAKNKNSVQDDVNAIDLLLLRCV